MKGKWLEKPTQHSIHYDFGKDTSQCMQVFQNKEEVYLCLLYQFICPKHCTEPITLESNRNINHTLSTIC